MSVKHSGTKNAGMYVSVVYILIFYDVIVFCRSMLMTACDISAITKPWPVQKKVNMQVYITFTRTAHFQSSLISIQPRSMGT